MNHKIGIMGAGNISGRYLSGLRRTTDLDVTMVADLNQTRAQRLAAKFGVPRSGTPAQLLASDDVDVVINLTPPVVHARSVVEALKTGKNVYVEKPLATTREDGTSMLEAAETSSGLLGSAPDTFLGSAGQTARAAVDAGLIGEPLGASAFVRSSRAETWHPDPRFLYGPGGGPVMDMGPYYLAALVHVLGPVATVAATSRVGRTPLQVTAPDRLVETIDVSVPTHVGALLTLESGMIVTSQMSFDVWDTRLPRIEIYGTEGTLSMNDPNSFDGDVHVHRHGDTDWQVLPPVTPLFGAVDSDEQHERGLGVRDLIEAIDGAPLRVDPTFAFHVLDVMLTVDEAAAAGRTLEVGSTTDRPAPMSSLTR